MAIPNAAAAPTAAPQPRTGPLALAMLRAAVIGAVLVGINAMAVAGVALGPRGVWGALLGMAIVVAFSGSGLLLLHAARRRRPQTQMIVALSSYTGRVALFAVLLAVSLSSERLDGWVHPDVVGLVALACIPAWTAGEIWGFQRTRIPTYDLDDATRQQR